MVKTTEKHGEAPLQYDLFFASWTACFSKILLPPYPLSFLHKYNLLHKLIG